MPVLCPVKNRGAKRTDFPLLIEVLERHMRNSKTAYADTAPSEKSESEANRFSTAD